MGQLMEVAMVNPLLEKSQISPTHLGKGGNKSRFFQLFSYVRTYSTGINLSMHIVLMIYSDSSF